MKLAEALSLRANAKRRIEQLRARVVNSARYQEGEEPAEDAAALLTEVDGSMSTRPSSGASTARMRRPRSARTPR